MGASVVLMQKRGNYLKKKLYQSDSIQKRFEIKFQMMHGFCTFFWFELYEAVLVAPFCYCMCCTRIILLSVGQLVNIHQINDFLSVFLCFLNYISFKLHLI